MRGELGYGSEAVTTGGNDPNSIRAPPAEALDFGGRGVRALAGANGGQHMCAVLDGGDLTCWGFNARRDSAEDFL